MIELDTLCRVADEAAGLVTHSLKRSSTSMTPTW